jgi:hypothetical protein
MQDQRIRDGLVCVSRDGGGDWRRVLVPVAETRFRHLAVARGGDHAPLPEPMLAVYADSEWVPAAWRSGRHGRGSMKFLVEPEWTDATVLERLRVLAASGLRHSREEAERRSRRHAERVAAAVGAAGEEV